MPVHAVAAIILFVSCGGVQGAEWRFQGGWEAKPGENEWPNAGFFIHAQEIKDGWPMSLEVLGYFGETGSLFGVRGGKIRGAKRGPFVKDRPNEGRGAWPEEGNVCLQSEGWPVFYRNVEIKELP